MAYAGLVTPRAQQAKRRFDPWVSVGAAFTGVTSWVPEARDMTRGPIGAELIPWFRSVPAAAVGEPR